MKLKAITFSLTLQSQDIKLFWEKQRSLTSSASPEQVLPRSKPNRRVINMNWCLWLVYFVLLQAKKLRTGPVISQAQLFAAEIRRRTNHHRWTIMTVVVLNVGACRPSLGIHAHQRSSSCWSLFASDMLCMKGCYATVCFVAASRGRSLPIVEAGAVAKQHLSCSHVK
jgi:hypothetical protein